MKFYQLFVDYVQVYQGNDKEEMDRIAAFVQRLVSIIHGSARVEFYEDRQLVGEYVYVMGRMQAKEGGFLRMQVAETITTQERVG